MGVALYNLRSDIDWKVMETGGFRPAGLFAAGSIFAGII